MDKVNLEASKIGEKLGLNDRIDKMNKSEAFITIKDTKERFPDKIDCRLINPAKSNIGKISKTILDRINDQVRKITKLQQWKSTSEVVK